MTKVVMLSMPVLLVAGWAFGGVIELNPDSYADYRGTDFTQHELMWDDGVHCGYYSGPNVYYATTFTAPFDLMVIATKIFWYNCSSVNTCYLDIYSDVAGEPGAGLFASPVTGSVPIGG